jgi:pyridoxamine 5'-phosphate oxidase
MSLWSPPPPDAPARLADLRGSYAPGSLGPSDLAGAPLDAFLEWFGEAERIGLPEPNAMVLATADPSGAPSARTVLLKAADPRGFTFYTNLTSRKSADLTSNPKASVVFPWIAMHRQICVVGDVELLPRDEVEEYFRSRPRGSQLGAWASAQSTVIPDRSVLEARFAELDTRYADRGEHSTQPGNDRGVEIPVPDFWGGWLVRPRTVEFWQGRPSRLHDRLRFRHVDIPAGAGDEIQAWAPMDDPLAWTVERLSP